MTLQPGSLHTCTSPKSTSCCACCLMSLFSKGVSISFPPLGNSLSSSSIATLSTGFTRDLEGENSTRDHGGIKALILSLQVCSAYFLWSFPGVGLESFGLLAGEVPAPVLFLFPRIAIGILLSLYTMYVCIATTPRGRWIRIQ